MEISLEDFRRHFEILSDDALLATNREDLVDMAKQCYDAEVARRGLNAPSGEAAEGEVPISEDAAEDDHFVEIANFNIPDEANLARGLLESAGIPYSLQNEYSPLGGIDLRLMVPASLEEQAIEILQSEISEEELAAQAEAAGFVEEEAGEAETEEAGTEDR
jgi:hypothetical protein